MSSVACAEAIEIGFRKIEEYLKANERVADFRNECLALKKYLLEANNRKIQVQFKFANESHIVALKSRYLPILQSFIVT